MRSVLISTIFVILISASTRADDTELDLDELKSKLPANLLPSSLQNSSLPSLEETKALARDKCIRVSGSDAAFEEAEEASVTLKDCFTDLFNMETLQEEIRLAEPTGDLDTVFNKYCKKRQIAIDCVNNFTASVDHCLEPEEKMSRNIFVNIFTSLLNFVCHKDGDQIALFIAEKGPECFQEKADAIKACANATLSKYMPSDTPTLDNLPKFVFGEKECGDMDKLQVCVVHELESCQESTPANLVEAMFRYIRNETPCVNFTKTASEPLSKNNRNAASNNQQTAVFVAFGTLLMASVARSLIKF